MSSYAHSDPIVLSFKESCLRSSDIQLLRGPHWLNDQILSFYYEYLEHNKYKCHPQLLFVPPEVTQCIKMMDGDELDTLLDQLRANFRLFIFFALNDNETTQAGGTHWSLLVFSKPERTFFHYDSYGNSNIEASHVFVSRLRDRLGCSPCQLRPMSCLQQINSYDCGIHVICMTEHLADFVCRHDSVRGADELRPEIIRRKRSELLRLIQALGGQI